MALDSKQKRMAVPGVGRPWMRAQNTDVAKDGPWRACVGLSYPVVAFILPAIETPDLLNLNLSIPIAVDHTHQAEDQQYVLIENFILLQELCLALEARIERLEP